MTVKPQRPAGWLRGSSALAVVACLVACQATAPVAEPPQTPAPPPQPAVETPAQPAVISIPDREIGLSKESVFEAPVPAVTTENQVDPGELPPIERAFDGAPPLVPHAVTDMLPIRTADNLCVDCHAISAEDAEAGDPTPMPVSHYTDIRGGGAVGEEVIGSRWLCMSCHVAPSDAEPLVGNAFRAGS